MRSDDVPDGFKMTEIGFLPNEWEVTQLAHFIESPQYGYTARAVESAKGPRYLRITDIQNGIVEWTKVPSCECDATARDKFRLEDGDILVARIGATTGKSFMVMGSVDALFASYLMRIRTKDGLLPEFLHYLFDTRVYWNQIENNKGGRLKGGISIPTLRNLVVPIPPIHEQKAIACVLSKVREATEKTDVVITALRELKKSLMKHLFTYGPISITQARNSRMEETAIGPIPASWNTAELKHVCRVRTSFHSFSALPNSCEDASNGVRVLAVKVSDMNLAENRREMNTSKLSFYCRDDMEVLRRFLKPEAVIFPKRGAAIGTNKKRITKSYCVLDPNLMGIEPSSRLVPGFLHSFFERFDLTTLQDNNPIPQFNKSAVENIILPIPPFRDQEEIAHIAEEVEMKVEVERMNLEALNVLFQTLLESLVTGRIRVNNLEVPT